MQVSLEALEDDRLPQDEPIEAKFSALDTVAKKLFFNDALPAKPRAEWPPQKVPDWLRLSGIMPPGQSGQKAWREESGVVGQMMQQAVLLPGFEHATPMAGSRELDVFVNGHRVTGQVEHVYAATVGGREQWQLLRVFGGKKVSNKGKELKKEKDLNFKDRVPMFLDWAFLRLHSARLGGTLPSVRLRALVDGDERPWQEGINVWDECFVQANSTQRTTMLGELEQRLAQLLAWWIAAQSAPRWYFPKSAWEAIKDRVCSAKTKVSEKPECDADDAASPEPQITIGSAWIATHKGGTGERDYAPGYSHLLAGEVEFVDDSTELQALAAFALELHECISMTPVTELPA
jgi:exodeoxyribonuclease V gamma subunit